MDISTATPARIMVVEDQALVALDIESRLRRMGYEVVARCGKPEPAVAQALELKPDLILMDINLNADMDGIEVAEAIHARENIPIIFCTAYSNDEILERAKLTTPCGYVLKPFDDRELEINISMVLYKHGVEAQMHRNAERLTATMDSINDAVIACDGDGRIFLFNPRARSILNMTPQNVQGALIDDVLHLKDITSKAEKISIRQRVLDDGECYRDLRQLLVTTAGDLVPVEMSATLIDPDQRGGAVIAFRDISRQIAHEEELQRNSFVEPLTGLPNREVFMDRLRVAFRLTRRLEDHRCAVMFINVDRFRSINDGVGHEMGDQVLRLLGGRIESCLRDSDTLTRLSADTFVCLLDLVESEKEISNMVQLIQHRVAENFDLGDHLINLTASVGIAISDQAAYQDYQELLRDADTALHQAKLRGPGSFMIFDRPMRESALKTLELKSGLRRALENDELSIHFQPIYCAQSGNLSGLEALLRWHSPQHGTVSPDEFIPLAEETGLIESIGTYVLVSVCRQIRYWEGQGLSVPRVSVNLSGSQFQNRELAVQVGQALARFNLNASQLTIEVTESMAMNDVESSIRILQQIESMGMRIAVDDFGTGYSSLAYLKRLPLHTLKIDRSFVTDLVHNADEQAIIKGIIAMAHELRLEVLAEGVESQEQADLLKSFGCDHLQGFHLGRPASAYKITSLLELEQGSTSMDNVHLMPLSSGKKS
ncbi:MAG: EAL domain-containing protein [Xanthomonadales bacterium]|nr:EAL domain-containing protein [Xanthomonadales bacterium]